MAKQPVYLLIFLTAQSETWTMDHGWLQLTANTKTETIWSLKRMPAGTFLNAVIQLLK